jgi:hypothetical protein
MYRIGVAVAMLIVALLPMLAKVRAPLPDKLLAAKTAYLENQSGDAGAGDRLYEHLQKWGRFTVLTDKSKADVVILLSRVEYQGRKFEPASNESGAVPSYRPTYGTRIFLSFIDRQTGELLWSHSETPGTVGHAVKTLVKEIRERMDEAANQSTKK